MLEYPRRLIREAAGPSLIASASGPEPEIITPRKHKENIIDELLSWDEKHRLQAAEIIMALDDCFSSRGGFDFAAELWTAEAGLTQADRAARSETAREIRAFVGDVIIRLGEALQNNPTISTDDKRFHRYLRGVGRAVANPRWQPFFQFWRGQSRESAITQEERGGEQSFLPPEFNPSWFTMGQINRSTDLVLLDVDDLLEKHGLAGEYQRVFDKVRAALDRMRRLALDERDEEKTHFDASETSLAGLKGYVNNEEAWRKFCAVIRRHPDILLALLGKAQIFGDIHDLGKEAEEKQKKEMRARLPNMFNIALRGSQDAIDGGDEGRRAAEAAVLEELYGDRMPQEFKYKEEALWLAQQIEELIEDIEDEMEERDAEIFKRDIKELMGAKGKLDARRAMDLNLPVLFRGIERLLEPYRLNYDGWGGIDGDAVLRDAKKIKRILNLLRCINVLAERLIDEDRKLRADRLPARREALEGECGHYDYAHRMMKFLNRVRKVREESDYEIYRHERQWKGGMARGGTAWKELGWLNHYYIQTVRQRIENESFADIVAGEEVPGSDPFYEKLPPWARDFAGLEFSVYRSEMPDESHFCCYRDVNLRGADFSGCLFKDGCADFSGADMRGAKFDGSYFEHAEFDEAAAERASFRGVSFSTVVTSRPFGLFSHGPHSFRGAKLKDAVFNEAGDTDIGGVRKEISQYAGAYEGPLMDFAGADLEGASFRKAVLTHKTRHIEEDWTVYGKLGGNARGWRDLFYYSRGSTFSGANLRGARFDDAYLERCLFSEGQVECLAPWIREGLHRDNFPKVKYRYYEDNEREYGGELIFFSPVYAAKFKKITEIVEKVRQEEEEAARRKERRKREMGR